MEDTASPKLDPATWIGRCQAFGFVANQCSAAQAECIRAIRETSAYKSLGLTWEQFCDQHLGLNRTSAEAIIHNYEEFGAVYFRLAQITHISPELYRRIAPQVVGGESLDISGQLVPIVPENAARIRAAVQTLRADLQKSREEFNRRLGSSIVTLQARFEECFREMRRLAGQQTSLRELRALCEFATTHLNRISADLK